jgi:hypothetical protein
MLKIIFAAALAGALAACSVPQTKSEFRQWVKDDPAFISKKEAILKNTDLKTVEKRMIAFGNKCLNLETYATRVGTFSDSTYKTNTFKPSMDKEPGRVSLYMQQLSRGHYLNEIPEDGPYVFLAEATKEDKPHQVRVAVYHSAIGHGNIGEDAMGWLVGESEFCPNL